MNITKSERSYARAIAIYLMDVLVENGYEGNEPPSMDMIEMFFPEANKRYRARLQEIVDGETEFAKKFKEALFLETYIECNKN